MKRSVLIRHLSKNGWRIDTRRWATLYMENVHSGEMTAVPRHNEIKELLARKICKDLGIVKL